MPEELFEVWVDGRPIGYPDGGAPFLFPRGEAERRRDKHLELGHAAVVVPDQSQRPPDAEMLRGR